MQNTSGGIQHILLRLILLERVNTVKKPQMNNFDCMGFSFYLSGFQGDTDKRSLSVFNLNPHIL